MACHVFFYPVYFAIPAPVSVAHHPWWHMSSLLPCVPVCPPPWGLCHQAPLCGQPSVGSGSWWQELCQLLLLACCFSASSLISNS